MTDKEFDTEVKDLVRLLYNLRRIKDKGLRKSIKNAIMDVLAALIKDLTNALPLPRGRA